MSQEYRLVVERPEHQEGRRQFRYKKRSLADAEHALEDHDAHAQRMYEQVGLTVWEAWIETRQVGDWLPLDDEPVEAVPVCLYRVFTDDADLPDDGLIAVEMRNPNDKPRIRLIPIAIDYEAAYARFDEILARPEDVTADIIMGNLNSIVDAAIGGTDVDS